jgi:NADPH-dependent ferric siderophore reductase
MLEVDSAESLTPHLRRVVFRSPTLAQLDAWPAAHVKLFFPRGPQREPVLPTLDTSGRPVWPALDQRPVTRTYSLRRYDRERCSLTIDFALHEPSGPAATWAARAEPGQRVGLAGPGGPRPLLRPAPWYLLAGDLSALPAMAALLEGLPGDARGHAFIQVPSPLDMQVIRAPEAMRLTWLVADADAEQRTKLVESVQQVPFLPGDPFVWLAGENAHVVALRDFMRRERAVPSARLYAVPYWKRSESEEEYHAERHRVMDELAEASV